MKRGSKKLYLEILRILAIFLALYCHTGMDAVYRFTGAGSTGSFALGVGMRVLASTCNIIFFMISGALLLEREESLAKVLIRGGKMVIVILLFSFFQMLWKYYTVPGTVWDLADFFETVYAGPFITQYWFLYEYVGFLLGLPLLRILVKHMEKKHFQYIFLAYVLVCGLLPFLEDRFQAESLGIQLPFLINAWVFALWGYFAEKPVGESLYRKKEFLWINAVAVAAFVLHGYLVTEKYVTGDINPQNGGMLFLIAAAVFADVRLLCEKTHVTEAVKKVIVFIGSGVFGVFLLEPQVRGLYHFVYEALQPYITWFPATVLWLLPALLTGSLVMNLLKRIPLVKGLF